MEVEDEPENCIPDLKKTENSFEDLVSTIKRGKDKRERRNQRLSSSEKTNYAGKNYIINTVDLSESGDLVSFVKNKSLIEINEKHHLYEKSSKIGHLDTIIRDIAFTEISADYSEGNLMTFNIVYNELMKLYIEKFK